VNLPRGGTKVSDVIQTLSVQPRTIRQTFSNVVAGRRKNLILDDIDLLPNIPGFRIRSHDPYGPLPEILIKDTGESEPVLNSIKREAARLCAVVWIREDIATLFPGCRFLLPTKTDDGRLVGIRFAGITIFAEHKYYWEAYHRLLAEAVDRIL
jgi:hypothetical protein